jgi:hypothetical protein
MEQKRNPIVKGDVLTLGQQEVYTTLSDIRNILAFHDLPIKELPSGFDTTSKLPAWEGNPGGERKPNAQSVFTLLGADRVYATDISKLERPDFIIDLNEPVDASYHERFDTIVDVGTLEHVFDIPTALKNIVKMCRKSGSVILINPCSGAIDHGFYQFSPTLYFDYFGSNGFSVVSCYLNEPLRWYPVGERKGRIFKYEYVDDQFPITSRTGFEVAFFATKNMSGNGDGSVKPFQSLYRNMWNAEQGNKEALSPSDEEGETGSNSLERCRQIIKKIALKAGVPIPSNAWIRLILSFRFGTVVTRLFDRTKLWHPLWLNRYLFDKGRGRNIRCIATYSASGHIRLTRSNTAGR